MKSHHIVGILLVLCITSISLLPLVKGETQSISAGETWYFPIEDAKKGDIIDYEYSINDPDSDDKLNFWIESPDGTKYASKSYTHSGNGEFSIPEDGIWKVIFKNNNWFDSIMLSYNIYIKSDSGISNICCFSYITMGFALIVIMVGIFLFIKRKIN